MARVGTRRVPGCKLPGMDRHAAGKRIGNWHVIKRRLNSAYGQILKKGNRHG